jgi:hypothetical protein
MYNITVKPGRTIAFEFLEMNLPRENRACAISVIIRNGRDALSPLLGEGNFCGVNEGKNITRTTSNRAFVKVSLGSALDTFRVGGSFKLRYREVQKECGGNIRLTYDENSTEISSPNYPNVRIKLFKYYCELLMKNLCLIYYF